MVKARRIPADSEDALRLTGAMVEELNGFYGELGVGRTPSATPADLSAPGGGYVALYEDGRPVAGGGVKRLSDEIGEIKRMYVVPEARSRGLARRLLAELEQVARGLGYETVRLDTGREQPHAEALYRSAGYRSIGNYNANIYASYWGEKRL
jgi:GNAT superfamily N-acetyltransferase